VNQQSIMEPGLGKEILDRFLQEHWVSVAFLTGTLTTMGVLLAAKWWLKRRWKKAVEESRGEEHELDLLTPPGEKDQEALEVIRGFRREVWEWPDGRLQLSVEALTLLGARIVQSVARVYHQGSGSPEYEASLVELLQLMRRVASGSLALPISLHSAFSELARSVTINATIRSIGKSMTIPSCEWRGAIRFSTAWPGGRSTSRTWGIPSTGLEKN